MKCARVLVGIFCAAVWGTTVSAREVDLSRRGVELPGRAFTIALAVTPAAQTAPWDGLYGYVCGTGTGYWDGFRLRLKPSRYGCEPSLEIGKPKGEGSFILEAKDVVLPAGMTRHLAATWDGRTARLYVGGRCVAESAYAGAYVQEGALPFTIGHAAYGLGYCPFQHGAPRLWDEALGAERVAALAKGVETMNDADVATFTARPIDETIHRFAEGTLEPKYGAMAEQLVFNALNSGAAIEMPVVLLDRFTARIGTNDWHRALDFELRRARALAREGRAAEGLAAYASIWTAAKTERKPYAAWAGLAYADALARAGDPGRAAYVRREAKTFARSYLWGECVDSPSTGGNGVLLPSGTAGREFFVSPCGDDAGDGTIDHPFATLARAQRAVREVKKQGAWPKGGVTVWLRGGAYPVKETLELTAEDSGAPEAPVAWKAWKDECPVLDGGWRVPEFNLRWNEIQRRWPAAAARIPETARGEVVACDVKVAGYTHFERIPEYGFYCGENAEGSAITDLWCGDRALELAREPNEGWLQTGEVLDAKTNRVFRSDARDLARWKLEPEAMLTGFWKWHWADLSLHVGAEAFDPVAGTIALGKGHGGLMVSEKRPYFIVNALGALDRPGEWYLDRAAGVLYLWPEGATRDASVTGRDYVLSDFSPPFITMKGVKHAVIEGLVLQQGRGTALVANGCADVVFAGNVVRRFGNNGLVFTHAKNIAIRGNVLRDFGHGALRVSGGNRKTLEPSGISVVDNEIAWVERWKRTYAPGLHGDGCGTEVARNHFHDMRSSAMRLEGNDWWIASNIVERVVTESDDQGGIDIYANPSYAGDVICFNVWRDIGCGGENAPCGQAGVRFDDAVSTMFVYGNYFENCSHGHFGAVQMNGGRNNTVDNNVFVNCPKGVTIGRWPQNRWEAYFQRPEVVRYRTKDVDVTQPPYSTKYPGIADLPKMGLVNWLTRNVTVGEGILSAYPQETVTFANRSYVALPSRETLAREPGFRMLPPESSLGPRATRELVRARRNSAIVR